MPSDDAAPRGAMDFTSVNRYLSRDVNSRVRHTGGAHHSHSGQRLPGHAPGDLGGLGEDILGAVDRVPGDALDVAVRHIVVNQCEQGVLDTGKDEGKVNPL